MDDRLARHRLACNLATPPAETLQLTQVLHAF